MHSVCDRRNAANRIEKEIIKKVLTIKNYNKMKKVLFALAIAGMFGFVACNNNKAVEEPVEDTTIEAIVEEVADSTTIENAVEEVIENAAEAVVAE